MGGGGGGGDITRYSTVFARSYVNAVHMNPSCVRECLSLGFLPIRSEVYGFLLRAYFQTPCTARMFHFTHIYTASIYLSVKLKRSYTYSKQV